MYFLNLAWRALVDKTEQPSGIILCYSTQRTLAAMDIFAYGSLIRVSTRRARVQAVSKAWSRVAGRQQRFHLVDNLVIATSGARRSSSDCCHANKGSLEMSIEREQDM